MTVNLAMVTVNVPLTLLVQHVRDASLENIEQTAPVVRPCDSPIVTLKPGY